jgi:hypothetical protein
MNDLIQQLRFRRIRVQHSAKSNELVTFYRARNTKGGNNQAGCFDGCLNVVFDYCIILK